jgi:NADPH-dependent curcumin reductase CurA
VDVLFENVGGDIFEAVLWNMRDFGRVALCGMIADYNLEEPRPGPRGMSLIIGRRLKIQGFIVTDVTDHPEACDEYVRLATAWLQEGKLTYRESISEGVENAPQAFIDLLKGRNTGKQIARYASACIVMVPASLSSTSTRRQQTRSPQRLMVSPTAWMSATRQPLAR